MAKAGGTLTANQNAEVLGADMNRQSVIISNLDNSSNHVLFVEFGSAATTTLSGGCFVVVGQSLTLHVRDFPEIRDSINLISANNTKYTVRTS
jgi:hypothetical protein